MSLLNYSYIFMLFCCYKGTYNNSTNLTKLDFKTKGLMKIIILRSLVSPSLRLDTTAQGLCNFSLKSSYYLWLHFRIFPASLFQYLTTTASDTNNTHEGTSGATDDSTT